MNHTYTLNMEGLQKIKYTTFYKINKKNEKRLKVTNLVHFRFFTSLLQPWDTWGYISFSHHWHIVTSIIP